MPTEAQLLANRRNGAKSRGPVTDEGKTLAKLNAVIHGLRAQQVLLRTEDLSEFETFQEGMRTDLEPVGSLENFLFSQIVGYAWRLRRCQGIEGSVLAQRMGEEKVHRAYEEVKTCFEGYSPIQLPHAPLVNGQKFDQAVMSEMEGLTERDSPTTVLGAGFARGEASLRLLARYETSLTRNFTRSLGLFFEAQRMRSQRGPSMDVKETSSPPA